MAIMTVPRTDTRSFGAWFADFLRSELAPYPGRGMLVARMVIAATITMILIMTFRIPNGAIGPLYAFILSRENLVSTVQSAVNTIIAFGLCALFVPLGGRMFASIPITHFMWEAASLLLIFFLIRTLDDYAIASGIGLISTATLAIWYLPGPAERNVENTLWQILAPLIGAAVTIAVEAIFHAFDKKDELVAAVNGRLKTIEDLLLCYANGEPVPRSLERTLTQEAMVGSGGLRRLATLSNYQRLYRAQMNAVVSLTGRSVDFAAALVQTTTELAPADREAAKQLAWQLAAVRQCVASACTSPPAERVATSSTLPLLRELEEMFSLIPNVFEGSVSLEAFEAFADRTQNQSRIFIQDAFNNPEYLQFASSGCLAGMLCYTLYVLLAWPGLATSVTTCAVTALSNIGSSRQKQLLRIAGAAIGGFIFGMGAQILILPWLDSIAGFTVLFAAVTAVAAWVATSSTRLSYCGLQIALAFYLIQVSEFRIQLSLSIARDRVLGVLLGITMMWLAFDRLHPKTAVTQMVETFTVNLGLLAKLITLAQLTPDAQAIARYRRLRHTIYGNFAAVNAQADAVPFEIGPLRNQHMAARDRIRRWQARLRTLFLLELALLQYRAFAMAETVPRQTLESLNEFDEACANMLRAMAVQIERQSESTPPAAAAGPAARPAWPSFLEIGTPDKAQQGSIVSLAREIARILDLIWQEMSSAPLYAVE